LGPSSTPWEESDILVVDDDVKLARLIARALSAAGYTVATAATGRRALSIAAQAPCKVVVLDLMLPDIDGRDVLKQLHDETPHAQVLVLTGVNDLQSKVQCFEDGAVDYVTKPFELPELVARIRSRFRPTVNQLLERAGFTLDLRKRRVSGDFGTLALSTREFSLLEYLMRHDGDDCTRDELLEHVWGYTFEPTTNVLDVYVGRLRNKLGPDCIHTVRNVGYTFVGA
jgi:DNA-binding response OmpR family regulator